MGRYYPHLRFQEPVKIAKWPKTLTMDMRKEP